MVYHYKEIRANHPPFRSLSQSLYISLMPFLLKLYWLEMFGRFTCVPCLVTGIIHEQSSHAYGFWLNFSCIEILALIIIVTSFYYFRWEAGPKFVDGLWAPWWYKSVHQSTGFTQASKYPQVSLCFYVLMQTYQIPFWT